ncbi:MAG: UbiA family prenyltransferase [Gammaproteobacteria bacterium]|nr:UbiA family prenyltransferase [Gammaproteobacteria bacterium]
MDTSSPKLPLYVDLDGTLIKSDLMFESILLLVKQNLMFVIALPFWLVKGRAYFKAQLAERVQVSVDQLPVNKEFHAHLQNEKKQGRELILISASNQDAVEDVSSHFNLFSDAIGSGPILNLKAHKKLEKIKELTEGEQFSYAGNSIDDLPIWQEASEALLVNCSDRLANRVNNAQINQFDRPPSLFAKLLQAMRPHQWLKNLLVFVTLVLSHQLDQTSLLLLSLVAYISFCLCASSVYFLNDLFDLNSDRKHQTKCKRAFASGDLPLAAGFIGGPILFLAALAIALSLPQTFILVLLVYWLLTSLYTYFLKTLFLVDVFTLAILYTLRIVAGAAAISVEITVWLLAFSFFLFLGLALVKRVTELLNVIAEGKDKIEGRAYRDSHISFLSRIGSASSAAAIVVFILYITAPETTELYNRPLVLWLICPLLMFLLYRIWQFAHTQKLEEDPVLFALTDRVGQAIALACGMLIWIAA